MTKTEAWATAAMFVALIVFLWAVNHDSQSLPVHIYEGTGTVIGTTSGTEHIGLCSDGKREWPARQIEGDGYICLASDAPEDSKEQKK